MEFEQQFHDLEQRYVSLKSEYDLCRAENTAHTGKIKSLQSAVDQTALQESVSDRKIIELTYKCEQKDKLIHDLQLGQEELNDRDKRRSDECDRLRDDLKAQVAELLTLQTRLKDAQLSLSEFQSVQLPTQYELTKTLHEKELLGQQVQYLQEELQKKLREERQLRAEHIDRVQQLETALSASTSEAEDGMKQIGVLKDQAHDQQEKLTFYMNKLKNAEAALVEKQGSFSHEVEGLKRLNELYKRYLEDATAKVDDLEKRESITRSSHADLLSTLKERISILAGN